MTKVLPLALVLCGCALGLVACGGGGGGTKVTDTTATAGLVCGGTEVSGDVGLPESFPEPSELTYVGTKQQGPTRIVEAYFEGDLESAYNDYKDGFEQAGYDVTFDEIEDNRESEVAYEDPQSKTNGLVALKTGCDDPDRVSVRITNRPE